jgi:hypothetical protein
MCLPASEAQINRLTNLQDMCVEELRNRNPEDKGKEVLREDKGK